VVLTWRDGTWLDQGAGVAPSEGAVGVFTTVGCDDGEPLLWERHRARLEKSLEVLGSGPAPRLPAADEVATLLRRCGVGGAGRLRMVARRRAGGWSVEGSATAFDAPGPWAEPQRLAVVRWPEVAPLAGHKSLARAAWDQARESALRLGCDDALIAVPGRGALETSVANVFAIRDDRVATPPAPELCLPGVMRGWLLDALERLGLAVEQRPVALDELEAADEVWTTNALIGVRRVGRLGERSWRRWPMRDRLIGLGVPAPGWPRD